MQLDRKSRSFHGNSWEECPIGLPFKIALQLHFEPVIINSLFHKRDFAAQGLTPITVLAWSRKFYPAIDKYYLQKLKGGLNLFGGLTGHQLTGKALYELVHNSGLYYYVRVNKQGVFNPSSRYIRNHPEWIQPQGPFKTSLLVQVTQLVTRFEKKNQSVTTEELQAIGIPFLAWQRRTTPKLLFPKPQIVKNQRSLI